MRAAFERVEDPESPDGPNTSSTSALAPADAPCRDRAPPRPAVAVGISSDVSVRAEAAELLRSSVCANGDESIREACGETASALRFGPMSEAGVSPPPPADARLPAGSGCVGDARVADGRGGRLAGTVNADLWTGWVARPSERAGAMETAFGFGLAAPSPNAAATSANSASSNLENIDLRLRSARGHFSYFCSEITIVPSSNMENLRRLQQGRTRYKPSRLVPRSDVSGQHRLVPTPVAPTAQHD